jgi:hypothetical protein
MYQLLFADSLKNKREEGGPMDGNTNIPGGITRPQYHTAAG